MAGVILIIMGLAGFGRFIKFIPYPVTTGFTTGIAVIIAAAQLKDFFGLQPIDASGAPMSLPPDFVPKIETLAACWSTFNPATIAIGTGSLAGLIVLRRFLPKLPGAIVVAIIAGAAVLVFKMDTATIGSRFGGIPRSLPMPQLPSFHPALIRELIPAATTIAFWARSNRC